MSRYLSPALVAEYQTKCLIKSCCRKK